MKLKIVKNHILEAFRKVSLYAKATRTNIFTDCVALIKTEGGLNLYGTDLYDYIQIFIPADFLDENIDNVMLPLDIVKDYLNAIDDEFLDIEITQTQLKIFDAEFLVYELKDFFFIENLATDIETVLIKEFLTAVSYSKLCINPASENMIHRVIHLNKNPITGNIDFVSNSESSLAYFHSELETSFDWKLNINIDSINRVVEILKVSQESTFDIRYSNNLIQFYVDNIIITTRLFKEEYPDYLSLLKYQAENTITVSRLQLTKMLNKVLVFSKLNATSKNSAYLTLKDGALILNGVGEKGKSKESIKYSCANTLDFSFYINCKDLIDIVYTFGSEIVEIYLDDKLPLIFFKEDNKNNHIYMLAKLSDRSN